MFSFTNRKFLIKKFCEEKNRNLEKKSSTFKETSENSENSENSKNSEKTKNNFTSNLSNLSKFIPIKIYKKNISLLKIYEKEIWSKHINTVIEKLNSLVKKQ